MFAMNVVLMVSSSVHFQENGLPPLATKASEHQIIVKYSFPRYLVRVCATVRASECAQDISRIY